MPSGLTSTSSCVTGASSASDCSGVKDMLPRPWYERVQSIAGTPSSSGGASESPSVRDRWRRAAAAAESAVTLRAVGTGGSLAPENCGVTVRGALDVVVVVLEVAGLAAEVVDVLATAAFGAVAYAALMCDEENPRCCIRYASGAALDEEPGIRADMPRFASLAAIVLVWSAGGVHGARGGRVERHKREVTV